MLRYWVDWLAEWFDVQRCDMVLTVNCFLGNGLELAEIEEWWLRLHGTARITVHDTFIVQAIYGAVQEFVGVVRPEWLDLATGHRAA